MKTVNFMEALKAIGARKKVTCTVDDGNPIVYEVQDDELTINDKVFDIRDFCFSPKQILFGKWIISCQANKEEAQ